MSCTNIQVILIEILREKRLSAFHPTVICSVAIKAEKSFISSPSAALQSIMHLLHSIRRKVLCCVVLRCVVLCCGAWCVVWSGGELTLQQRSVPESCSLNSCLGNKDKLLCGCNILKKADNENERRHAWTHIHKKEETITQRCDNTLTYLDRQTQTVDYTQVNNFRPLSFFLFVVVCNLIYIYNISKPYKSKALSSHALSCSFWLCVYVYILGRHQ